MEMRTALTEQTVSLLTAQSTSRDTWVGLRKRNYDTVVARVVAGKVDRTEMEVSNRGPRVGDLLWTGGSPFLVASARLMAVLRDIGATGWASCPAEIRYKNGDPLPGFEMLVVTGHCGDPRRVFQSERVAELWSDWDGSDLSWIGGEPWYQCVVTERVREALVGAELDRLEWSGAEDL